MKKNDVKGKIKPEKVIKENKFDVRKMNRRNILFFVLLCFLIYGKSSQNNYSMDDEFVIRNNVQVQKGIKAIPEIFSSTYVIDNQKSSYEYRPIVKAFFAIEYQIIGAKPHISHFLNVLLYAISIALLYSVLLNLLSGYNRVFPFLITLFFLIHPLHSEVVLSLKNRDVILSFIGCLLALKFYIKFIENNKYYDLFFGAFFILFALMSKKDSMTYLAIIPFTMWFFKDASLKKILWMIFSLLFSRFLFFLSSLHAANLAKKVMIGAVSLTNENGITRKFLEWENPLFFKSTVLERIPTGFYSIYFYLKMFIFPHPLLSYYGYNQVPIANWSNPIVWGVIFFLILVGYYVVKHIKSKSIEVYGILYFLITISMFTNVLQPVVGIVGERFAYIPSLGLCIVSAWALLKLFKISVNLNELKFPTLSTSFSVTIILITLVCSGRSFARIPAWKDAYSLYSTDVNNASESAHANSLIAAASVQKVKENPKMSIQQKRFHISNAEKYYLKSIEILPNYISSLNNLGMIYFSYYNKPDKAIPYLKKAILLDSNYVEAYFNLATCEVKSGQLKIAEKHYLKTLEIDPSFINSYKVLSTMYANTKEFDKILDLNKSGLARGLNSDLLHINMGNAYFIKGDTINGINSLVKAVEANSNNKKLNSYLASYYKNRGELQKAEYYYNLMVKAPR